MRRLFLSLLAGCSLLSISAAENVRLVDVPDYAWHAGCFGTAAANLIGYWDRHGLPNMYTGPTGAGVAPLTSAGSNVGIRALWASQAGLDGRPADQPGHIEDYWEFFDFSYSFESTAPDPYVTAGRPEHTPDCLGDFMGLSQRKYSDLNGECTGNIDGFAFNYWDKTGARLENFEPPVVNGVPVRDIQSGVRHWSTYRGYAATVTSQLADFNPTVTNGRGFTFEDLRAEIDAGYPVLLILQDSSRLSRSLPGLTNANPEVHAMVAFGYVTTDGGQAAVRFKTSWASGDGYSLWENSIWEAALPLRGLITYHPLPRITSVERISGQAQIKWDGPQSVLLDELSGTSRPAHGYVVERAESLDGPFEAVTEPTSELQASVPDTSARQAFYRVRLTSSE